MLHVVCPLAECKSCNSGRPTRLEIKQETRSAPKPSDVCWMDVETNESNWISVFRVDARFTCRWCKLYAVLVADLLSTYTVRLAVRECATTPCRETRENVMWSDRRPSRWCYRSVCVRPRTTSRGSSLEARGTQAALHCSFASPHTSFRRRGLAASAWRARVPLTAIRGIRMKSIRHKKWHEVQHCPRCWLSSRNDLLDNFWTWFGPVELGQVL